MKNYLYCVSDVHSYYNELMTALDAAGFDINNEKHIFVSCGDLLDRGPDALKCLRFVNSIPKDRRILIRGNHEILANVLIGKGYFGQHDWWNGTAYTAYQLSGYPSPANASEEDIIESFSNNIDWLNYYKSTVYFKEIGNYIFTHGWIPYLNVSYQKAYNPNWRECSFKDAIWDNGMELWSQGIREPNKTIICGHYHTSWGHKNLHNEEITNYYTPNDCRIFEDEGIIALDTTTCMSKLVNVKVLEVENEIFKKWI